MSSAGLGPYSERRCAWCSDPISSEHESARYCSGACRTAAWRERHGSGPICVTGPSQTGGPVIYAVEGAGLIKIGVTFDLANRMMCLRGSSPVPLEVIASAPGNASLERELHDALIEHRRHGEWFELSSDDRQWLIATLRTEI